MKQSKKREELERAVAMVRQALEARREDLWNAEKTLSLTVGVSESGGGWTDRKAARTAQEAVYTAKAAMEEASRKFEEAEGALIEAMADEEDRKKKDFAAWIVAATE